MTREELTAVAEQYGCETPILEPGLANFDEALAGYVESADGIRAVYNYHQCIKCLMEQNEGMTYEEAVDTFSYNTERALPHMGPLHPLILHCHCSL